MYVELHAASAFSFLEGASVPEELAAVCAEHGMPGMAMADREGVYGAPRFHMAMKKAGMKAHIGSEITFAPRRHTQDLVIGRSGDRVIEKPAQDRVIKTPTQITRSPDHPITRLPLLVANQEGYQNLCRLV
ncbi:MAG TPA: PHP domain-containing protein, partial [Terriglobales bacterium]